MLRNILYKLIRKMFFPFLNYSYFSIKAKWLIGLHLVEPYYFDYFLTNKKDKYLNRLNPNKKVEDHFTELLKDVSGDKIKILDVGAGPITAIGYKIEKKIVDLYPIDPLAKVYNKILKSKKIHPPVKTITGDVDRLSKQFRENEFDLIHANNSIDHTANPIKAIKEMHHVLKPNRYLYLNHFRKEGEQHNYYGLHQWNFYCENDNLFVCNKTKEIDVNISDKFKDIFSIEITVIKRRIIAKFKKIG